MEGFFLLVIFSPNLLPLALTGNGTRAGFSSRCILSPTCQLRRSCLLWALGHLKELSMLFISGEFKLPKGYCDADLTLDSKLEVLLPRRQGLGLCSTALVSYLISLQNDFIHSVNKHTKEDDRYVALAAKHFLVCFINCHHTICFPCFIKACHCKWRQFFFPPLLQVLGQSIGSG